MLLRPSARDEAEAVADVHRAAFGSDVEADLALDLMLDDDFVPSVSFVAEEDGRLVGSVVFSRAWFVRDDGLPGFPLLLLAPLAVAPAAQRAGVGTALVEAAIAVARESGEVAMLVFGNPGYYARFGFIAALPKGIRGPHPLEPEWGWQVLELAPDVLGAQPGYVSVARPLDSADMWLA